MTAEESINKLRKALIENFTEICEVISCIQKLQSELDRIKAELEEAKRNRK